MDIRLIIFGPHRSIIVSRIALQKVGKPLTESKEIGQLRLQLCLLVVAEVSNPTGPYFPVAFFRSAFEPHPVGEETQWASRVHCLENLPFKEAGPHSVSFPGLQQMIGQISEGVLASGIGRLAPAFPTSIGQLAMAIDDASFPKPLLNFTSG